MSYLLLDLIASLDKAIDYMPCGKEKDEAIFALLAARKALNEKKS
jgi:hypothetical protein